MSCIQIINEMDINNKIIMQVKEVHVLMYVCGW